MRSPPWSARTRRRAARTTWCCSATTRPTAATSRSASGSPTSWAAPWSTAPRPSPCRTATTVLSWSPWPPAPTAWRPTASRCPPIVTIREGGVEPRYPSVPGRLKAKKVPIEERQPVSEPTGPGPGPDGAAAADPERRADPGRGPGGCPGRRRRPGEAGSADQMILTLVETDLEGAATEVSLEAVSFARDLSAAGNGVPVDAVVIGDAVGGPAGRAGGVRRPDHPPRRRRRRRGVLRCRLGVRDPDRPRGGGLGGRAGRRHRPRQRADGARRRALGCVDGRERAVVLRAGARSSSPARWSAAPRWRR